MYSLFTLCGLYFLQEKKVTKMVAVLLMNKLRRYTTKAVTQKGYSIN